MTQPSTAALLALALAAAYGRPLPAQQVVVERPEAPVPMIGGDAEDRARIAQLRGADSLDGFLLRSSSSRAAAPGRDAGDTLFLAPWWPQVTAVSNSALPFSLNDGALWAGRGTSVSVTGGVRARYRFLHAVLAPTYVWSQNLGYPLPSELVTAGPIPEPRSPFSYPWRVFGPSIDYPTRFGDDPYQRLDLGESAIYARLRAVEFGLSNESEWWGPAVRNALVMSNNAPGIGKLFVRTARPIATPVGAVEARYMLGVLATSPYFETVSLADRGRSLSAAAVTLRPAGVPTLSLGLTRAVFAQLTGGSTLLGHALDVLGSTGRPNAISLRNPLQRPGRDQILSLFARLVLPDDGFESYVEWGRAEMPANVRDLLVAPNHTQGYTLGLQYARPVDAAGSLVRVQAEVTNVEQSSTFQDRPTGSWYTSRAVLQGYTQRGQVIGAAIGPGASSQWLASDFVRPAWSAGLFAARIRWDDDAHFFAENRASCTHDVSVLVGARGGHQSRAGTVTASLALANRLNAFYQNNGFCFSDRNERVDTRNTTLSLTFVPRVAF
ncbi:MAG: hypothetical protein AVDCRST_MAG40-2934 [uncultured Gemmatimonadaceae bacterium]|uniref:Uncharacterized protein n=1 Tax=uncultured Gemmatimonadaceae bacterium TaxID=246130 RepID=A0A6J4M8Y6_9BACT|nr:MAG: hypothetical protein AVDCRST_MAG40-2934 [uncultured Gemmatimonadaceae bacterium]